MEGGQGPFFTSLSELQLVVFRTLRTTLRPYSYNDVPAVLQTNGSIHHCCFPSTAWPAFFPTLEYKAGRFFANCYLCLKLSPYAPSSSHESLKHKIIRVEKGLQDPQVEPHSVHPCCPLVCPQLPHLHGSLPPPEMAPPPVRSATSTPLLLRMHFS